MNNFKIIQYCILRWLTYVLSAHKWKMLVVIAMAMWVTIIAQDDIQRFHVRPISILITKICKTVAMLYASALRRLTVAEPSPAQRANSSQCDRKRLNISSHINHHLSHHIYPENRSSHLLPFT